MGVESNDPMEHCEQLRINPIPLGKVQKATTQDWQKYHTHRQSMLYSDFPARGYFNLHQFAIRKGNLNRTHVCYTVTMQIFTHFGYSTVRPVGDDAEPSAHERV